MARFSLNNLDRKQQEQIWDDFCQAVLLLKNIDEARRFLRDILNKTERTMIARRLEIAMLLEADFTYQEIKQLLGVSHNTIAKVSRWLYFGRNGYRLVLQRKMNTVDKQKLAKKYIALYGRD